MVPAAIVYIRENYDFDPRLVGTLELHHTPGILSLVSFLARTRLSQVEVNEPLFRAGIRHTSLAVVTIRAVGGLRGVQPQLVTYAIENLPPPPTSGRMAFRKRASAHLDLALSGFVAGQMDRIAYGSEGAQQTYTAVLGPRLRGVEQVLIPALPCPCDCARQDRNPDRLAFVGALSERKGFPELLHAWPVVKDLHPRARLTIVGKGPMQDQARALAASDSSVETFIDPPRLVVHEVLRRSSVLVLLSQPRPTWREQLGLPILEGLSHGCAVVTTTETGMAPWLVSHGHLVLDAQTPAREAGQFIALALAASRGAESVLQDLPSVDGRLAADAWLFRA